MNRGVTKREAVLASCAVGLGAVAVYVNASPVRQRAADNAARATCISNLKQLSLAIEMYTHDYDEKLPRAWFGRDAGPSDAHVNSKWMDAIFPYVKRESVFSCPADAQSKPYRFRDGQSYGSYLFNDAYFAGGDKLTPPGGQRKERIGRNTIVLMCGGGSGGFRLAWPDAKSAPAMPPMEQRRLGRVRFVHTPYHAPIVAWADGMAVNYSAQQVLAPRPVGGRTIYAGLTIEDD